MTETSSEPTLQPPPVYWTHLDQFMDASRSLLTAQDKKALSKVLKTWLVPGKIDLPSTRYEGRQLASYRLQRLQELTNCAIGSTFDDETSGVSVDDYIKRHEDVWAPMGVKEEDLEGVRALERSLQSTLPRLSETERQAVTEWMEALVSQTKVELHTRADNEATHEQWAENPNWTERDRVPYKYPRQYAYHEPSYVDSSTEAQTETSGEKTSQINSPESGSATSAGLKYSILGGLSSEPPLPGAPEEPPLEFWTDPSPYMSAETSFLTDKDKETLRRLVKSWLTPGKIQVTGEEPPEAIRKLKQLQQLTELALPSPITGSVVNETTDSLETYAGAHNELFDAMGLQDPDYADLTSLQGVHQSLAKLSEGDRERVTEWMHSLKDSVLLELWIRYCNGRNAFLIKKHPEDFHQNWEYGRHSVKALHEPERTMPSETSHTSATPTAKPNSEMTAKSDAAARETTTGTPAHAAEAQLTATDAFLSKHDRDTYADVFDALKASCEVSPKDFDKWEKLVGCSCGKVLVGKDAITPQQEFTRWPSHFECNLTEQVMGKLEALRRSFDSTFPHPSEARTRTKKWVEESLKTVKSQLAEKQAKDREEFRIKEPFFGGFHPAPAPFWKSVLEPDLPTLNETTEETDLEEEKQQAERAHLTGIHTTAQWVDRFREQLKEAVAQCGGTVSPETQKDLSSAWTGAPKTFAARKGDYGCTTTCVSNGRLLRVTSNVTRGKEALWETQQAWSLAGDGGYQVCTDWTGKMTESPSASEMQKEFTDMFKSTGLADLLWPVTPKMGGASIYTDENLKREELPWTVRSPASLVPPIS